MFATTDLIRPLAGRGIRLSSSQVYRLVVERPERLSLEILMALCDILGCAMIELIEPVAAGRTATGKKKAAGAEASLGERAVSDPIGLIVELVAQVEPVLSCEQIRGVLTTAAGGRAKARRLAVAATADRFLGHRRTFAYS